MDQDVIDYIETVPESRAPRFNRLHRLILELYPQASVDLSYRMPTYRHGQGWVALANQKHYISLYTCGYDHIQDFIDKHPDIKTGKGCINLRDRDELPLKDLGQVIRHAMESVKPH